MRIDKVWVDDHAVYASTTDGQQASASAAVPKTTYIMLWHEIYVPQNS